MNDEALIRKQIDSFVLAYNSQNLEEVMSYYSEDVIKMRQGSDSETKKGLCKHLQKVFESYKTSVSVTIDEIVVDRELAFSRGTFEVTLSSPQKTSSIPRRYLEVWRNENGTWRVIRTMDN